MKTKQEVSNSLRERLLHDWQRLRAVRKKQKELGPAYNEYVDLDSEGEIRHHRMSIILGLLGPENIEGLLNPDETASLEEVLAEHKSPGELRLRLRLWRAIREYLRAAGKSKISDIHEFLVWIGMKGVTRPAIESALKQHEDAFELSKRGSERYVNVRRKKSRSTKKKGQGSR